MPNNPDTAWLSRVQQCLSESGAFNQSQLDIISGCMQAAGTTPPPDPPDPPDPPPVGTCLDGFQAGSGWWNGFCIDEPPKFRSETSNTVGVMGTNANGYKRFAPNSGQAHGKASIEIRYETDQIPQDTGGGHLFTAQSGERALNPDYIKGWFRPDIVSQQSQWKIHTYNNGPNGEAWFTKPNGQKDHVVDVWSTGIPNAGTKVWIPISLEWNRVAADKMWMRFSAGSRSAERTVTIHPQSVNP